MIYYLYKTSEVNLTSEQQVILGGSEVKIWTELGAEHR